MAVFRAIAAGLFFTTAAVAAEPIPTVPPWQGVYQPKGVDETGLWSQDDEGEKKLRDSSVIVRDEALTSYLQQVLCRAVGNDRCGSVRIYVIKEPAFQATMSPNGTMRIFTGLLLRCRNEAELAAILGHEFGHFEQRHGLNGFKKQRGASDLLSWASVLAATASTYYGASNYRDLQYSVYGNLHRYGRDQEREADRLSIAYLNVSELRPQAASRVWVNLMAEIAVSAQMKGYAKPRFDQVAYTASHPPVLERAVTYATLAAPEGDARSDGHDRYAAVIKPLMGELLADQIKLNDFGGSEYIINSLASDGWTSELWFARGELFRLRGNPRDHENAADFYREAIALDPAKADAYRGLGFSLMKTNRRTEAVQALTQYLSLKPDAQDKGMIQMLLPPLEDIKP